MIGGEIVAKRESQTWSRTIKAQLDCFVSDCDETPRTMFRLNSGGEESLQVGAVEMARYEG